jgi:hypothetical protein
MNRLLTSLLGIGLVLGASLPALSQQRPPTAPSAPSQSTLPPSAPSKRAPATAGNRFDTEAAAKTHCPSATVVWVNLNSKIYHFSGYADYGHTKSGTYMCEQDATAGGFRAAKNEKHP